MSLIDLSFAELLRKSGGDAICVIWSATRALFNDRRDRLGRESLVVIIELRNSSRTTLESWIESPVREKMVVARTPARAELAIDKGMMHLDVFGLGSQSGATVKLTLRQGATEGDLQLVFAKSSLLAAAGFLAGSYDPPTLKLVAEHQSAVSA